MSCFPGPPSGSKCGKLTNFSTGPVYFTENVDAPSLITRCLAGESSAFEPIVEAYQRVLFNVALRMLGSREDAKDATQAAFLKAYEHLASYDPRHKFFSW